jgi:hypothetical protein
MIRSQETCLSGTTTLFEAEREVPGIFFASTRRGLEAIFFLATPIGLQLLILALEVHMNRLMIASVAAALLAGATPFSVSAFTPQTAAATNALTWLHTQQGSDGTIAADASRTEETVWGLAANGKSVASLSTSGKTTVDSLRSHIATEEKTAGNIGSLVLAVAAAGLDSRTFAGHDLLQDLQCTYNAATGAYNSQIFNDALAVLAIPSGKAPQKAVGYLGNAQQSDGGWEFSSGFGSDTNTTGVVLMALKSAGGLTATTKAKALVYLKSQQQTSGGFEYTAGTGDSDPDSDALTIEGLLAVGEDPTSAAWSVGDKNALTDLLTFQYQNGGFGYFRPGANATAAPDAFSTTQPLVAIASRYLPVQPTAGAMPTTCPAAAPSTQPTPVPTPRPIVHLATTGASRIPQAGTLLLALAMLTVGWTLRRRAR